MTGRSPHLPLNPPNFAATLARCGLRMRGHWTVNESDRQIPRLPGGNQAAVMVLVGVAGSDFWPHFRASPFFADGLPDPLDRWSRAIGDGLALELGGLALYPFDGPPWHPFQQWADRGEPTQPSRMMLRIHPEYGLWHAYRFALLLPPDAAGSAFARTTAAADTSVIEVQTQDTAKPLPQDGPKIASPSLCASCAGQPCLKPCPVQAYTGTEFRMQACADHLHSALGQDCMEQGCRARLACPVGAEYRYTQEHAAFHMRAFLGKRQSQLSRSPHGG